MLTTKPSVQMTSPKTQLGIFLPCPHPSFHPLAWPCAHLPGFQWCSMGSTSSLPPMVVVVTMPITHWQRKATQLHNFPLILPTWKSKKSLKPTNHSWMEFPKTLQVIPLPPCGVQWKKLTARPWKLMGFADYVCFERLLPGRCELIILNNHWNQPPAYS